MRSLSGGVAPGSTSPDIYVTADPGLARETKRQFAD